MRFDQQLWVRVTVFENVYKLFGSVGAAFEIIAILTAIVLIFLVSKRGSTFYWTWGVGDSLGSSVCELDRVCCANEC